jgi:hypothetical protein
MRTHFTAGNLGAYGQGRELVVLMRRILIGGFLLVGLFFRGLIAQELREQPTSFSVWLDFRALASANPPRISLPIWLASLGTERIAGGGENSEKTIYRIHFRRATGLHSAIQIRFFFDDLQAESIMVSGWSETGTALFEHGPFGAGLGLPTSETLTLPVDGLDYLDLSTKGDGKNIRGVFLASLKRAVVEHALDYDPPSGAIDPFGNLPLATLQADDYKLYGRVKASIDAQAMKLNPSDARSGTWEFELQSLPLIALLGFEVLGADALAPLEVTVNDRQIGPVAIYHPDLADPAYLGLVRPLDRDMRFRYAGWLRGQKIIPGSALRTGVNKVVVRLHGDSGPLALRTLEMQLKYNTPGLDYQFELKTP